jgi:hypothetical protein
MIEQELFRSEVKEEGVLRKQAGPPNRMNDLCYRDWMKFQKSFFRFSDTKTLVEECIHFFTKSIWSDGRPSKSLIVGVPGFNASYILPPRKVDVVRAASIDTVLSTLQKYLAAGQNYDFVLIDLRRALKDLPTVTAFLMQHSQLMFAKLRGLLAPSRYSCILIDDDPEKYNNFPVPWAVALSARESMKLRDEKIGLIEKSLNVLYCLFLQAENDQRKGYALLPENLHITGSRPNIPAWIIPKPPPRKKNEILHPAKFPETLVSDFIEVFTQRGDRVFDPMVGTGSTVVAASLMGRDGYGVDLIKEFVEIACKRVASYNQEMLFEDLEQKGKAVVLQGDATKLAQLKQLKGLRFSYSVTSPPYWSMLGNPGSENQRARRQRNLRLVYSDKKADVGNVQDYDSFINLLTDIYDQVSSKLCKDGVLTVIVKNVKREHVLYPIAWDLTAKLCGPNGKFDYLGNTLWCQDDIGLKPFAVGIHWVSNTLHQYCLHFRKR